MANTKKDYPGPINDSDKKTLAGAGVDVSDVPLKSEEEENTGPIEEEKIIDIDGTVPEGSDADIVNSGIQFVKVAPAAPQNHDLSSLAEARMKEGAKELEEEFRSELSPVKAPVKQTSQKEVLGKSESLSELLARIEDKLGHKKSEVKEELMSLKKMKDTIEKDITEIKDLEASEEKIKKEIEKIDSIRAEVETIEEELHDKI